MGGGGCGGSGCYDQIRYVLSSFCFWDKMKAEEWRKRVDE